ncbi:uridine diphosphate-N-acetylglucosamine-binding protein YvcK [bacterium]
MKKKNYGHLKVVAIGGGTGLSSLLMGLKEYINNISAVVTVTDDGGSSGRLTKAYGILPPGDIRSCLVSLAKEDNFMSQLFSYRFPGKSDIAGHSFGNLFIMAMSEVFGGFEHGILESSRVLAITGKVMPATLKRVVLNAELEHGKIVVGETNISKSSQNINRVFLTPSNTKALPEVITVLRQADVVVLGPGSLYTSIIPNLLIKDIAKELKRVKAKKIFVCNIMSQPGETDTYTAEDHLEILIKHIGQGIVDYMIVNNVIVPKRLLNRYKKEGSFPVKYSSKKKVFGVKKVLGNLFGSSISKNAKYARHDPKKLAGKILEITV